MREFFNQKLSIHNTVTYKEYVCLFMFRKMNSGAKQSHTKTPPSQTNTQLKCWNISHIMQMISNYIRPSTLIHLTFSFNENFINNQLAPNIFHVNIYFKHTLTPTQFLNSIIQPKQSNGAIYHLYMFVCGNCCIFCAFFHPFSQNIYK